MFNGNSLTIPAAYILVLILCLASLVLFFFKRWLSRDLYGNPNVVFYGLFGLMIGVDLVWSILEYHGFCYRIVAYSANLFWYCALVTIAYRWLEACAWHLKVSRFLHVVPFAVRILPAAVAWALLLVSWRTGWIIDVSPEGQYVRGPYLAVVYGIVYFYIFVTLAVCLVKALRAQEPTLRQFAWSLFLVTMPVLFTVYLQYLTGFAFFFIGMIITVALYDFDIQRKAMVVLAETDKALHDAMTTVSHDIRTPLNAIVGFAELLQKEPSEAERRQMLHAIVTSGNTLMQLVNDVLDFSKIKAGKLELCPEPTDLSVLVADVVQVFSEAAQNKHLSLERHVAGDVAYVVDPQRLRQVLFNLLGNALKFTEHGVISVTVTYRNKVLSLAVADTGMGIAPGDQKRIMNPYMQVGRHKGVVGTGLGLSICKRLALLMRGALTVKSELGRGSTFTLTFPCATAPLSAAANHRPVTAGEAVKTLPARRMLIVDDSPMNLKVLSAMLHKLGEKDVTEASDGQQALELLQADPARFDIVLTDIQMPKMDGDELVRRIRADARLASLPVYGITSDIQAQADFADVGFTDIAIKPITTEGLRRLLLAQDARIEN